MRLTTPEASRERPITERRIHSGSAAAGCKMRPTRGPGTCYLTKGGRERSVYSINDGEMEHEVGDLQEVE